MIRLRSALPAGLALCGALAFLSTAGCGGDDSGGDTPDKPSANDRADRDAQPTPATDEASDGSEKGPSVADEGNDVVEGDGGAARPATAGAFDWGQFFEPGDSWKSFKQEFVFNNGAEPETLDPHKMTGVPEHNLALALFEGLTIHHPSTLQPLPGVAKSWEISDDGTVYTFHLRDDAKWSNGDALTSADFMWSWKRALSKTTASQYAYQFYAVKNAEAFHKEEITDFAQVGCKAPDPHTFVVTLAQSTPYFLDLCSFETLMPVHRATVEKHDIQWTRPENFVCNGPFVVSEWKPRDEIVMTPNPHYWNKGIVRLSKLRAKALDDMNTAFNEYLAGSVDWLKAVPQKRIDEVQSHPDYYVWPYLGTYFFRFNVKEAPFDDVRVRKAFNQAVNKESLCYEVLKAGQIPATGHVPPGIYGYDQLEGLPYDVKEAQRLLADAGFPDGKGFPEVTLTYNTSESHKQVCEVIASMWREVLGVRVKLRNSEWKIYLDQVDNLQYQIARAGWIGDYTDANTFMDMFVKDGGNNNTGWSNDEYDRLIREAAKEQDPAKRATMFQRAETILCVEEMPILPIYYYVNQGLLRPRVKGLHENIRDLHPFQFVYLDGPPGTPK